MATIKQVLEVNECIRKCLSLKHKWDKRMYFSQKLIKIKFALDNYISNSSKYHSISEIQELYTTMIDKRRDINLQYCKRDDKNQPVYETRNINGSETKVFSGLDAGLNPDYDAEVNRLVDEIRNFENEELGFSFSDFTLQKISFKECPSDCVEFTGNDYLILYDFIEDK